MLPVAEERRKSNPSSFTAESEVLVLGERERHSQGEDGSKTSFLPSLELEYPLSLSAWQRLG